jgi:WD40 repeat protein/beta-lactamase regulating signal transducer with metallopeptidase domain
MTTLLQAGLANAVCAALLAVPAVAAGRLRRPAVAHALWLLVLVKLVTPPFFPVALPWLPADPPPAPAPAASQAVTSAPAVFVLVQDGRFADGTPLAPRAADDSRNEPPMVAAASAPADPAAVPTPPTVAASADWTGLLAAAWLVGAAVWFVRAGVLLARFGRLLRCARPAPDDVQEQARRLAAAMGLRRAPAVWLLPGPLPPMVWAALGAARVYFPAGLLARLGDDERAALLAHELAHVRRRDHWVRRLELVVSGLYWWYPLTWLARRCLRVSEEECCDGWAAAVAPPRAYAEALVKAVDFLAGAGRRAPALASGLDRVRDLKRRLTLILCGAAPRKMTVAGRLALLAGTVLLLPLGPVLSKPAAPPPADPPAPRAAPPGADEGAFAPRPMNLLGGADAEVLGVAASPDGRLAASAAGSPDRPGEVGLWDLTAMRVVRTFPTPVGMASVQFSPDALRLGAAGFDGQAYVWDAAAGREVLRFKFDGPGRLAISPDGKLIATATESKAVQLWDAATGKEAAALEGDLVRFRCVCFSRSGKLLAAGGGDDKGPSQATIWDLTTKKQVGKLAASKPVFAVAFSPDGSAVATGDASGAVRVWEAATFKAKTTLVGHTAAVHGLAFSPDGKLLASGGADAVIHLWDVQKGAEIARTSGTDPVRSVVFTPDGKTLIAGGGRVIKLYDAATGKEVAALTPGPAGGDDVPSPLAAAFSPDGKTLALAADDGTVRLRDAADGAARGAIEAHAEKVTCLAYSPDGKLIATGSPDKSVRLWDPESGKEVRRFDGGGWVYAVAFSPDGKLLAGGGYDRTVHVWDRETGKELAALTGHKAAVRAVAFAPDGKTLVSVGADRTARLWDLSDFSEKHTVQGHEGAVRAAAYSPDGKLLATASEDGTVRLWTADGKEAAVLKGHSGAVVALAFSPKGTVLATGGADAVVRLWDPARAEAAGELTGCSAAVTSLAFAPDGRLAAACADKSVKVWKPAGEQTKPK